MVQKIYVLLMRVQKARAKFFWICSLGDKLLTGIKYLGEKSINKALLIPLDNLSYNKVFLKYLTEKKYKV